eukprot:TRINITY_DN9343_c0_g1_i1.p1 TRINITY_DN9343_c0_g1~~TRINITY_DN9343_c0_g1_i1.p1  ORF type:complete len:151 (-),score=35.61 TRINITY_DN9343_c0_g1_i1:27-479(-)
MELCVRVQARAAKVQEAWEEYIKSLPTGSVQSKTFNDMYLHPPADTPILSLDSRDWIRVRNVDGLFYVQFYDEIMEKEMNVRPNLSFEISVQTVSGLLSLGYQLGATLHRTTQTFYDRDGTTVSLETIQELEESYVQVKGTARSVVSPWQ